MNPKRYNGLVVRHRTTRRYCFSSFVVNSGNKKMSPLSVQV